MPQAEGGNARLIYDAEATFGTTPPTPDAKLLPFLTESFGEKRALIRSNIIRSNRNLTKPVRGPKDVSGSINMELNPFMGILLKHLLGSASVSAGPPYTHTITIGTLPVSLCIEKGFPDITTPEYFLYNGCRINRGSFEFNPDGFVPFNIDLLAQKETVGTATFDATATDLGHLPFEGAEMTLEEGGASIANVSKVTMELINNLDGDNYVIGGGGQRRAIPAGKAVVTGRITALFEDIVLYTKAINHTESKLKVILTRGTGVGSAGNEYLDFYVPELVYEKNAPVISGPAGLFVELPFSAYYDNDGGASSIIATLKNTQATL